MAIDKVTSAALETSTNQPNFRNIIINGDMSQAQRGTSVSSLTGTDATCDRWRFAATSAGTWTISQSTTVPTGQGFSTSLKMDCTTADASPAADDALFIKHKIEGQNLQYLKKGTSSAESLTLSFWVRSNKTGTYITRLQDADNSRNISQSYTISSADTWEKKTLTFAGDTSGSLTLDNSVAIDLDFYLSAGSNYTSGTLNTSWNSATTANRAVGQVNLGDSTSNDWYVTGVQLEAGTTASDFEFLPVDVNLARCQRYYQIIADRTSTGTRMAITCAAAVDTTSVYGAIQFPTPMRASATMLSTTVTNGYRLLGSPEPTFNVMSASPITNRGARISNGSSLSTSITTGRAYVLECELNGSDLRFEAEL